MIVAFYFRVGPTGGPFDLVTVAPHRYAIRDSSDVKADRGEQVPADLDPCGVEHACNLCGVRTLEATRDLQDDGGLDQFKELILAHQPIDQWWPLREPIELVEFAELSERVGHVDLCPSCYGHHGGVDEWPDEIRDRIYGPESGPQRFYPEP